MAECTDRFFVDETGLVTEFYCSKHTAKHCLFYFFIAHFLIVEVI